MGRYLDKFNSTLPAQQARRILSFLADLKNSGQLRTVEEYNAKLQELVGEFDVDSPAFQFLQAAVRELISSRRFNAMVKATQSDMESLFSGVDNLGNVLDLHESIYKLTTIEAIRRGIQDLERRIALYEFIYHDKGGGWTDGIINTFDSIGYDITPRTDSVAGSLYYDWQKTEFVPVGQDALTDLVGERLVLPALNIQSVDLAGIEFVMDGETTTPPRDLQLPTQNINNVIDGAYKTYWMYPVLLPEEQDSVRIKLKVKLGGIRRISILRVEPITRFPMVLEKVIYVNPDGDTITIDADVLLDSDKQVYLDGVVTDALTLTLRQDNSYKLAYYYQPDSNIWEAAFGLEDAFVDTKQEDRIADITHDILQDETLIDATGIPPPPGWEQVIGYQYDFGLDNIHVYTAEYDDRGIFVSKVLHLDSPGLVGLRADEFVNPVTIGNSPNLAASFEYHVIKRNYDVSGRIIDTEVIPILPANYDGTVAQERLWPSSSSWGPSPAECTMRFLPRITIGDSSTYPVVSWDLTNDLEIGTDYSVDIGGLGWRNTWDDVASDILVAPQNLLPLKANIRLAGTDQQAIYTVSYQARFGCRVWEHARYTPEGYVMFDITRDSGTGVDSSDIYLSVIMRRNWVYTDNTCGLYSFKFLAATYDPTKFDR